MTVADWIAFYVVHHSNSVLWIDMEHTLISFHDIIFFIFLDFFHVRSDMNVMVYFLKNKLHDPRP